MSNQQRTRIRSLERKIDDLILDCDRLAKAIRSHAQDPNYCDLILEWDHKLTTKRRALQLASMDLAAAIEAKEPDDPIVLL